MNVRLMNGLRFFSPELMVLPGTGMFRRNH